MEPTRHQLTSELGALRVERRDIEAKLGNLSAQPENRNRAEAMARLGERLGTIDAQVADVETTLADLAEREAADATRKREADNAARDEAKRNLPVAVAEDTGPAAAAAEPASVWARSKTPAVRVGK